MAGTEGSIVVGEIAIIEGSIYISSAEKTRTIIEEFTRLLDCDVIEVGSGHATIRFVNNDVLRLEPSSSPFIVHSLMAERGQHFKGLPVAGYVEELGFDAEKYHLRNGNQPRRAGDESQRPVGILEELRHCDEIIVDMGAPPLMVRLTSNVTLEIQAPPDCQERSVGRKLIVCSPHVIRTNSAAPSMLGNLVTGLFNVVNDWRDYERHVVTLGIRGEEPLDLPLLWADESYVVEGSRPLAVSWIGGEAPFAVEIGPEGGAPLVAQERVSGQASEPVTADLAPGVWRVSVRDAGGEVARGAFTVVAAADLPEPPPDEGLEAMPEALRDSAYAAWLAEQDEGSWMYEAYLRAGALAGDFAPAGYLERYLASGALWQ
jgi:hypothetical protein